MEQPAFIATGVPQLDLILGGGIAKNSLFLIAGLPGSGKTVLAAQIAFTAARRDERVLLITAFSEPHSKLISNLRTFSFFDQSMIGERIKLINMQHQLTTGTDAAEETIVREVRAHRSDLVVLDGFQSLNAASRSSLDSHRFLYDLNAKLSLLNVAAVITYNVNLSPDVDITRPELTAVDGIVMLSQELIGDHVMRLLQVVKQRGTDPLLGRHSFVINSDGLNCYLRQEAVENATDGWAPGGRVSTGIASLDTMLGGGINHGTNAVIAGPEGVGKTLLSLHFVMQGIAENEKALYITFHETAPQLGAKGQAFGFDMEGAQAAANLLIRHYRPAELNADVVAQELREIVTQIPLRRLVIDGLYELELALRHSNRGHAFFSSLIAFLHHHQISTYFLVEIDPLVGREQSFEGTTFSTLADNVLLMRRAEVNGEFVHSLVVLKMRFSKHDRAPHTYTIDDKGLQLSPGTQADPNGRRARGSRKT